MKKILPYVLLTISIYLNKTSYLSSIFILHISLVSISLTVQAKHNQCTMTMKKNHKELKYEKSHHKKEKDIIMYSFC